MKFVRGAGTFNISNLLIVSEMIVIYGGIFWTESIKPSFDMSFSHFFIILLNSASNCIISSSILSYSVSSSVVSSDWRS